MKILVFLPSYNDRQYLPQLIREILALGESYSVLVIDDGSESPLTLDVDSTRAILYRIPFNAGLGVSTNIALDFAVSNQYNAFARIDSDGQHTASDVNLMVSELFSRETDICIGERNNHQKVGSLQELARRTAKRHMRFLANAISKTEITDWTSGCFALNQEAMKKLSQFHYSRYPEVELYLRVRQLGLTISNVSIEERDRMGNASTLTLVPSLLLLVRFYAILFRHLTEGGK